MVPNNPGLLSQTWTILQRNIELFLNNYKKIISTFVFTVLIALLIVVVCKETAFVNYEGTKSTLFTIVCAAIYVGMFNSLTTVVKERKIIKREFMTNTKILAYVLGLIIFQIIICAIQSLIFLTVYFYALDFPEDGLVFSSFIDYYITLFLIMLVSDLLGIVISVSVRNSELANLIAPIIIIIQLVLCGVLFTLEDNVEFISYFTVSKWGMDTMGSLSRLNSQPLKIQEDIPQIAHEVEKIYGSFQSRVVTNWSILLAFIVVLTVASVIILKRVEKDSR